MKTITEFSGNILRDAAKVPRKVAEAATAETAASEEGATAAAAATPEEGAPAGGEGAGGGEAGGARGKKPAMVPDADAIGAALSISGDKLARLVDALIVVGNRVETVKRVVVVAPENAPASAKKQGEFCY